MADHLLSSSGAPEPQAEPQIAGTTKTKRVAESTTDKGHTVSTSVSYRVSAKTGRKKRATGKCSCED